MSGLVIMGFMLDVGLAFLFAAPIFVSNAAPAIFGGGYPIDAYKNFFDGRRILGDHKTLYGLLSGLVGGIMTSIIVYYLVHELLMTQYGYLGMQFPMWIGIVMGWGCNFGDMIGSFIKRRINIKSGGSFPVFDQMGYMFFGLLWSWPVFKVIPWQFLVSLLVIAPLLHFGTNLFAYSIGVKDVPW